MSDMTRDEILAAIKKRKSLYGANLDGANLYGANLYGANLSRATRLPTGETWEEYLRDVVPSLCSAGGVPLTEVAKHWECHTWANCPMAAAFQTESIDGVPILLRPRADQFIRFFDANLIAVQVDGESVTFVSTVSEVKVSAPAAVEGGEE